MAQSVREVMTENPIVLPVNASAQDAAVRMRDQKIGDIIVEKDGALYGMVTDRDIVVRVVAEGKDASTTDVESIVSVRASTEWMTKESAGGPDSARQFGDAMDGECRQTRQDAGQVVTNRDFEAAAAFNDGQNSGHLRASLGAA